MSGTCGEKAAGMFQVKGGSVLSALLLQEKLYPHHNNLKPIHAHSWAGDCCWPITLIFPSGPRDMGMLLKQRLSESSLRSDAWSLEGNAVPPYERLTISNKKDVSMCPHLSIYICACSCKLPYTDECVSVYKLYSLT